jgi:hypothetical protein
VWQASPHYSSVNITFLSLRFAIYSLLFSVGARSRIPVNIVRVQFIFIFANSSFVWTVYYTKILFSSILLSTNSNHVSLTCSEPDTGQFPLPPVITAPPFVNACVCCTGNFLFTNRCAALCPVPVSHTLPASGKLCEKPQVESRSFAARTVNLDDVCVCGTTRGEVLDRLGNWQLFPKYSAACASCGTVCHVQVTTALFKHSLSFSLLLLVFHMVGTDVCCRPTAPPPSQKNTQKKRKSSQPGNVLQPLTSDLTFRVGVCSRLCDITCLSAMLCTIGLVGSRSKINMKSGPESTCARTLHCLFLYQTVRHHVAKDGNLDFIVMFENVALHSRT